MSNIFLFVLKNEFQNESLFKLAKEWKLFGIFRVPSVSCSTLFSLEIRLLFLLLFYKKFIKFFSNEKNFMCSLFRNISPERRRSTAADAREGKRNKFYSAPYKIQYKKITKINKECSSKEGEKIMLKYNKMVKQFNNFFNGLKNVKLFLLFNKNRTKEFLASSYFCLQL